MGVRGVKLEFNSEKLISATHHAVVVANTDVDVPFSFPVKWVDGGIGKDM